MVALVDAGRQGRVERRQGVHDSQALARNDLALGIVPRHPRRFDVQVQSVQLRRQPGDGRRRAFPRCLVGSGSCGPPFRTLELGELVRAVASQGLSAACLSSPARAKFLRFITGDDGRSPVERGCFNRLLNRGTINFRNSHVSIRLLCWIQVRKFGRVRQSSSASSARRRGPASGYKMRAKIQAPPAAGASAVQSALWRFNLNYCHAHPLPAGLTAG